MVAYRPELLVQKTGKLVREVRKRQKTQIKRILFGVILNDSEGSRTPKYYTGGKVLHYRSE